MAIYGHMNKKTQPQDDEDPPPDKTDKVPLDEASKVEETISSLLEEANDIMNTQQGIKEETNRTNLEGSSHPTEEAEQHFTIANSPTRFQHHKDTTEKPNN